jgi:hypothetical protein
VECASRQELLIEITVGKREEVSIRFNQFYEGYLDVEERLNYQYSPVLMELYQVNENAGIRGDHTLLIDCQGCNRAVAGARSSRNLPFIQILPRIYSNSYKVDTSCGFRWNGNMKTS